MPHGYHVPRIQCTKISHLKEMWNSLQLPIIYSILQLTMTTVKISCSSPYSASCIKQLDQNNSKIGKRFWKQQNLMLLNNKNWFKTLQIKHPVKKWSFKMITAFHKNVTVAFFSRLCFNKNMLEVNLEIFHIFLFAHDGQHWTTMAVLSGLFTMHQLVLAGWVSPELGLYTVCMELLCTFALCPCGFPPGFPHKAESHARRWITLSC